MARPPTPDAAWHDALAYALVGERFDFGPLPAPDVPLLVGQLAALGWDAARIRRHALGVRATEAPWPHPIPDALRAGLGAAQLHAALGAVRDALGVAALDAQVSTRTTLNADERRLLNEVPPHHVRF